MGRMIVEHVVLPIRAGQEADFETTFGEAKAIIAGSPGFRSLTLARCIERPDSYLLLVEWDRLEDHTEGFRGSARYEQWRSLLHPFYDPAPVVEHYELIDTA